MLSKNTTKLGIGDENHGPLIKLQQDPPKVMQKRHLGHLPPKKYCWQDMEATQDNFDSDCSSSYEESDMEF